MTYEKSCGAVVFTRIDGEIHYLLVQNLNGIYGYPKGHMEPGERELETARREIREEVGLEVEFIPGFRGEDAHRIPGKAVMKEIIYFLAEFSGQEPHYLESELSGCCLVSFAEAMEHFQFESSRRILREADGFLREKCCVDQADVV